MSLIVGASLVGGGDGGAQPALIDPAPLQAVGIEIVGIEALAPEL